MSTPRTKGSLSGIMLTIGLLALAVAIAAGSLLYGARTEGAEFGGADGQAEEVITRIHSDYQPWFSPLVGELPGEVESGLFALQAGIGGIILGCAIGWYAGRHRGRREATDGSAPDSSNG
ncbi:energy-coupling factor ABC transporter substrate-binding protein [Mycolicibacterium neoaurum]|uniref:energy-coupling factor ABC transporter substrate-binding protein n=1 Tax=Mycolicibacterium neoaurum TaxID=1795 RepID=UPI00248CFEC6|nr:energy-coupling factor ABC transporter substrate-binding protein [Mycolicibacterium neoaurum]WBP92748.1 energy-coupling factor ABC transporter substrate-binding protein [Mycolicibacterium neoaurum]WBS06310.1 energy-coupling factor ABC transporter substrate-binding protein [Mycolicibacterium neoaurum]